MKLRSQISFLYYKDLSAAVDFYENVMGLEVADDQGTCKIYQVDGAAFLGVVDERHGHCSAPVAEKSSLVTFVADEDEVEEWYRFLKSRNVKMTSDCMHKKDIGIKAFFFEDPAGYPLEIQAFLKPELAKRFGQNKD